MKLKYEVKALLIFFSLITVCQSKTFAQDWTPFPAMQKTWFQFESDSINVAALYYASNIIEEGDKTWYHLDANNTIVRINDTLCMDDYKNKGEDFVNITEPFSKQNGMHYYKGQLVFNSNLNVGEGVFIQSENYIEFDEVYIECIDQRNEDVFGQSDEIKEFSLQAYANGQPIESAYEKYSYILSKSYGFLQFLPFIELLNEPKTKATITGFENEEGNLLGDKGNQFKPPYEVGDVIYYSKIEDNLNRIEGSRIVLESTRYWRDSITTVEYYKDSLMYTYDRFETTETYNLTPPNYFLTFFDTVQTFNNQKIYVYSNETNPAVDRGIYGYAINPFYFNELRFHYVDVDINLHDFSFNNELTSVVDISQAVYAVGEDGCLGWPNFSMGTTTYHTELGRIYESLADDCCIDETWSLDVYQKGDTVYSPLLRLHSNYDLKDEAVPLVNEYRLMGDFTTQNKRFSITGPGLVDEEFPPYFHPDLVPDSLLNVPFEITFSVGLWEFKQTITVTNGEDIIDAVIEETVFLKMFPNPNSGIFNITSAQPYTTIKIYNSCGTLVFSVKEPSNTLSHQLPSGVYVVEILNHNKTLAIQKLIVQ